MACRVRFYAPEGSAYLLFHALTALKVRTAYPTFVIAPTLRRCLQVNATLERHGGIPIYAAEGTPEHGDNSNITTPKCRMG